MSMWIITLVLGLSLGVLTELDKSGLVSMISPQSVTSSSSLSWPVILILMINAIDSWRGNFQILTFELFWMWLRDHNMKDSENIRPHLLPSQLSSAASAVIKSANHNTDNLDQIRRNLSAFRCWQGISYHSKHWLTNPYLSPLFFFETAALVTCQILAPPLRSVT